MESNKQLDVLCDSVVIMHKMCYSNSGGDFVQVADNIKTLRISKDLTQKDLADLLGVVPSTIGMYEQGRRIPDLEAIIKLAGIFEISTDSLLGVDTNEHQNKLLTPEVQIPEKEEIWLIYEQLDIGDKAEIRGEIKGMLRHEKYVALKPSQRHA